ncbi:InlB B-repeat-containing protein, partial [Candidatus Saccharibacteria bacterium]|nr:InlB B-repeat-containing protein [Candidatus Saccharibacteria bacterium]
MKNKIWRSRAVFVGATTGLAALVLTWVLSGVVTTATDASAATQLSIALTQAIAVRVLDSTATSEISTLSYNISPSPAGFTTRNSAVVDVATSNETGYSLSMTSDYRIDGTSSDPSSPNYSATSTAAYTTALVPSPASGISVNIPTSITATKNYWNYGTSWNEDLEDALSNTTNYTGGTSANKVIPAHTTSDTIRSDVDVPTDSSKTTINIDVNASEDIPTGTYNNRLVFTATGNPIPADYTLTYDKNTTDTVSNLPSPDTWSGVASSHTFTIPSTTTMARDGYGFVGWSTSATERQGSGSGPDGLYVAGDTYTVNATSQVYPAHDTGEATLYAIWEVAFSCVANQICYNPNGADVVGTMENQTTVYMTSSTTAGETDSTALSGSTTEFTLYSPNFSRTGYGFAGWNTKSDGSG